VPADRHALAAMNWDHGFHVFDWIIRQADTDITMATFILWQDTYDFYKPLFSHKSLGFE
jgi:hypothetical protein